MPSLRFPPHARLLVSWSLRIVTAAALAVDSYVHADLAVRYDLNRGTAISQGALFRIEAGISAFAALAVVLTAWRLTWALAFLVAASALGVLLVYRYRDLGALGPFPDMYEPIMYPEKTLTAIAEGVATVTALLGFLVHVRGRLGRTPAQKREPELHASSISPAVGRRDRGRAALRSDHRVSVRNRPPRDPPG